jgi:hypothetical protein
MQVLTHLILNDMIKVKGQISEMAICIVDHDERIASLAKLFFNELAKKVNFDVFNRYNSCFMVVHHTFYVSCLFVCMHSSIWRASVL